MVSGMLAFVGWEALEDKLWIEISPQKKKNSLFVQLSINIWNKPTTSLEQIFVAEAELQTSRYPKMVICYQL